MSKITAGIFTSVDGVVESPQDWHFPYNDAELQQTLRNQMEASEAFLLGRQTYEEFAMYWPFQKSGALFADEFNDTPKLVASRTRPALNWQNSEWIDGDLLDKVATLRAKAGRDVWVNGSPSIIRALLGAGLLDELCLMVHPIIVGKGARLFGPGHAAAHLSVAKADTLSSGVVSLTYTPAN